MLTEKQLSRYTDVLLWGLQTARKRKLRFNESALHWDFVNTEIKRASAQLKSGKK